MMALFLASLLILGLSLLQWFYVPKIGPNPFIGLRLGYTLSSREVWEKANRRLGAVLFLFSLVLLPVSILTTEDNVWPFVIITLVGSILITVYTWRYSAILLEETGGIDKKASETPIKPIVLGKVWYILPPLFFILLLLLMVSTYGTLPNSIAVHFNISGNPNNWQSRDSFFVSFFALGLIFPVLSELFLYAGKRYPMIVHSGRTGLDREDILRVSVLSLSMVNLLLMLVYADIYYYALHGVHMPYWGSIILFGVLIVLSPVFWILWKWLKRRHGGT